ncbi:hypothetical protein [Paenibacillus bouchesdurhonensis]|uniref:hypothetical protein n=1 Tax=Paenibacillus bouchesdurhonensis TaxID=1870990 RepID=UPI000DA613EA|nr:hypothetical protein [Paenibacillus bouchesdurhonensis]
MQIDDYELFDKDFAEFVRRGREAFGFAAEEVAQDTSRSWDDRIRATAEILHKERGAEIAYRLQDGNTVRIPKENLLSL